MPSNRGNDRSRRYAGSRPGGTIPPGPTGTCCWMAKFDISRAAGDPNTGVGKQANDEPAPLQRHLRSDSIRMPPRSGRRRRIRWGVHSQVGLPAILACFLGVIPIANAEPSVLRPSWDLDGFYVWLGPTGAASHIDAQWDSTFGGDAAFVRVREREAIGACGATLGASRWTVRGGGRIWIDALIGTRVLGHMVGASAGPIVELAELDRPHYGGSVGV